MYQPKAMYDSLFEAAWKTVDCFAKDPKDLAKAGMTAILHIPNRYAIGRGFGSNNYPCIPSTASYRESD
jgi:hypothetical protein